jgi:predicted Ser/Thr protein kinase
MGAVYLAREKALDRAVAIKVLPPEVAADAESRERFRREARTAAKLTHPNIVPLHTFGDVEGMLYFVMGYVKGESLAERMRREGKLPEEDVRRILAEVADALHYAHKQGVVHRDIKPDNILLEDETGRPMLTDFGVAKARASGTTLTEVGAVVGTPYYMSPEQASGSRDIDGRSDLYSLGVMGYQMLSGRLPFEGESFRDIVVQHVTLDPVPLATLLPEVPHDLLDAVMRCLAKEPGKRWPDGQQLRTALHPTDDTEDVPAAEARLDAAWFPAATTFWLACLAELWAYLNPDSDPLRIWWAIAPVLIGLAALVGGSSIANGRKRGVSWSAIWRRVLAQPRWWPFWWPRRWRRPGDVWDRLPKALRWPRNLIGTCLATTLIAAPPLLVVALAHAGSTWFDLAMASVFGLLTGTVWLTAGVVLCQVVWAGRRGIEDPGLSHLYFMPSSRLAFWRKPSFAALLVPASRSQAVARPPVEPRSPDEYAQAIRDIVGQLPSGTRATVSEVADAAYQLLGTLTALDAELARLAQDADPQELEAVEAKLRALGPEVAEEGEARRQKRALLAGQRDLLRHLDQRLADVTDRRARLLDLLRTMWLQVANLRAESAHDTLAVTEISGRIKALCSQVDAHLQAAEAVRMELQ